MNISTQNVNLGWQTAINGQTFGPAKHRAPDLWAWAKEVLQDKTLNREQVAALAAVLEYAINASASGNNPAIFNLACELFHNLNLGE